MTRISPTQPSSELEDRVRRILAPASPVRWQAVERGYTSAERWVVGFDDGTSAFVKAASDDMTAERLRAEPLVYSQVEGDYLPQMLAWDDDGCKPVLVLEDLSQAAWPPPWTASGVERVQRMLAKVRAARIPRGIPRLDKWRWDSWTQVAKDPTPFLSLGLCSADWLQEALPPLLTAERDTPVEGDDLVHLDVRSDNLCFDGERVLLVDWDLACRGNGLLDEAFWLPSLHSEGGPLPEDVSRDCSAFAALISGFFAARAGLPPIETAPLVRQVQLTQLRSALPWAVRVLGLPPLDLLR